MDYSYQNNIEIVYNDKSNKVEVVDMYFKLSYMAYLVIILIFLYYFGILALIIIYIDDICTCGCTIWLWSLINWALSLTFICYIGKKYNTLLSFGFDKILTVVTLLLLTVKAWGVYLFVTKNNNCSDLTLLWAYNCISFIDIITLFVFIIYRILVC
jgi:hypothetical protein